MNSSGQSEPQLTAEQRQYANELINRYTLNAERAKRKMAAQETSKGVGHDDSADCDVKPEKLSREDQTTFVNDIINKYDDKERSELSLTVQPDKSVSSEKKCSEHTNITPVILNVTEADEIIKKYMKQKSMSEVSAIAVN